MIKVNIYNSEAEAVGEIDLPKKIFAVKPNESLLHQAMVAQQANERQVLAHTLVRSEIRGGGKKPWRQKGTGRARVGSSRNPVWIGGGVVFGPRKDRNFEKDINKKMKQKALFMVLTDKLENKSFVVIEDNILPEIKTKKMSATVAKLEKNILAKEGKRSILVITGKEDSNTNLSARNIAGVKVINQENINIVDLLKYKNLVMTKNVAEEISRIYKK